VLAYARKVLGWEELLDAVKDARTAPQIPTRTILRSAAVMFLGRLGSLNALEQSGPSRFWEKWLGRSLPSADTVSRACHSMDEAGLRALIHHLYSRLKRMKALDPPFHRLMVGILDAHESHATYLRHCPGCLERVIRTPQEERIQYYHRHVSFLLAGRDFYLLLDVEPLRPGEDEVTAALRLLERVLAVYLRAFDVILGDGLYADYRVFNYARQHGKDVIAVLKDNHPDLIQDARDLFDAIPPAMVKNEFGECQHWDAEGFTSWSTLEGPVRVVRSVEKRTVHRQLNDQDEELQSEWMWATTLSSQQASTQTVVRLGHGRWMIENQGYNELVNRWHADHVYKHDCQAMLVFWLVAIICLNVFLAFWNRNLKPAVRQKVSMLHVSRLIMSELYAAIPTASSRAPP